MRKIVLALGVPALLTGGFATASSPMSSPPTSPPASDDEFELPADWVMLVDDTDTITVAVPETWTDIDTAPDSNPDGSLSPRISAATDLGVFVETFDAPGLAFWATTYTDDTESLMDGFGLTSGCRRKEVVPYDDGAFVGIHGVWTSCGSTGAPEWHQIVASPASRSFTFVVQIQIPTEADLLVLDHVLASFNFTLRGAQLTGPESPSATPGQTTTSTAATSSTTARPTTTTATPTTTPATSETPSTSATATTVVPLPPVSGTVPPDARQLFDDLGELSISVPAAWTAVETAPRENDDGTDRPWIAATTDLDLFLPPDGAVDTFSVPGVLYAGLPFNLDVAAELERVSYANQCTDQGVQPYTDGVFTGLAQVFADCGDTSTQIINIVANPADYSYTIFVLLQLTSDSPDVDYDTVMSSFTLVGPASDSGSTTTTAP